MKKIRASDRKALVKRPPKRWKVTSKPLIDRRGGKLQGGDSGGGAGGDSKGKKKRRKRKKKK